MLVRTAIQSLALMAAATLSTHAVEVTVLDKEGQPLNNIAVLATSDQHPVSTVEQSLNAVMDQINRQFVPHTLVVQKGTRVSFPNSDSVQHHVYSFSPAKTFELQLYSELEVEPQLFDNPGVVELGCNVHDWMLGYIYVADTPFFAQTNPLGKASIDLPDGDFSVSVWHPRISDNDLAAMYRITSTETNVTIQLTEALLPSLVEYDAVEGFNQYE